ncbi:Hypothetical predicted protein [Olea europaea subsp. europaea]|uniref:Uncharacterized protein n=1 Tax=Olea europaea subsp. europaea TaxID=158383 RepID=A0A8S0RGG8_OLEEU|nr:Hypothetical predicted protein [Olea europaea subsp. europaea]
MAKKMLLLSAMFILLMIYSLGLASGDNRLLRGMKKMRKELPLPEKKVEFLHGMYKNGSLMQRRKEIREKSKHKLVAKLEGSRPTAPGHSPDLIQGIDLSTNEVYDLVCTPTGDKEHNDDCQKILRHVGIPMIEAPSEAEAACGTLQRG